MPSARSLSTAADRGSPQSLAGLWRAARFGALITFAGDGPLRILDVGGRPKSWIQAFNQAPPCGWQVTVLSRRACTDHHDSWIHTMTGDPRALPFEDKAFDIVFSNSVIERVGNWRDQQRMASEVRRVAGRYFIRTSNRYFPVEPRVRISTFHFLPIQVRAWLLTRRPFGGASRRPYYADARRYASSIRPLTAHELRRLFPACRIIRERVGGLTKSFIAHS